MARTAMMDPWNKVTLWIAFSILLPLIPIPFGMLSNWLQNIDQPLSSLVRDGQICLFATAAMGTLVSDILTASKSVGLWWIPVVFCIVVSTYMYSFAVATMKTSSDIVDRRIAKASIWIASVTILTSFSARAYLGLF